VARWSWGQSSKVRSGGRVELDWVTRLILVSECHEAVVLGVSGVVGEGEV